MLYNIKNICWKLVVLAILECYSINAVQAQGVISLEEDASFSDELGLSIDSPDMPENIALPAPIAQGEKTGLISPQNSGKIVPQKGNSEKEDAASIEAPVPAVGKVIPKTGAPVPAVGKVVPKTGTPAPAVGKVVPKTGAPAPAVGKVVPKTGVHVPAVGKVVPKTGVVPSVPFGAEAALPQAQPTVMSLDKIDEKLFSQMSDLEKQTALLALELRREKLRNEVEAIKAQRRKALDEEKQREIELELKKKEKEKEIEEALIEERKKLRELDIAFEKLRQEKILNQYKMQMLAESQKWIEQHDNLYKELAETRKINKEFIESSKTKFNKLKEQADLVTRKSTEAKKRAQKEKAALQTQISILKARLEAEEKSNPFATANKPGEGSKKETEEVRLNDVYVIMEISGKGDKLVAKLINKDGLPFMVQEGSTLQTGHVVDKITTTYMRANKAGRKDFLYFSAGGILEKEPERSDVIKKRKKAPKTKSLPGEGIPTSVGIPGIGNDMTIR